MTFFAQLQGIKLPKIPAPVDGSYRFQVTEIYPNIPPVVYYTEISDGNIKFSKENNLFKLELVGNPLTQLEDRVNKLGCEAYIYPRFEVANV